MDGWYHFLSKFSFEEEEEFVSAARHVTLQEVESHQLKKKLLLLPFQLPPDLIFLLSQSVLHSD